MRRLLPALCLLSVVGLRQGGAAADFARMAALLAEQAALVRLESVLGGPIPPG